MLEKLKGISAFNARTANQKKAKKFGTDGKQYDAEIFRPASKTFNSSSASF